MIDRPGIYAALKVAEIWQFEDDNVWIERLHEPTERMPQWIRASSLHFHREEVVRWVIEEDSRNKSGSGASSSRVDKG